MWRGWKLEVREVGLLENELRGAGKGHLLAHFALFLVEKPLAVLGVEEIRENILLILQNKLPLAVLHDFKQLQIRLLSPIVPRRE